MGCAAAVDRYSPDAAHDVKVERLQEEDPLDADGGSPLRIEAQTLPDLGVMTTPAMPPPQPRFADALGNPDDAPLISCDSAAPPAAAPIRETSAVDVSSAACMSRNNVRVGSSVGRCATKGSSQSKGETLSSDEGEWQWEESKAVWRSFAPDVSRLLTAAKRSGEAEVFYTAGSEACMVDLHSMVQIDMLTGICRMIRHTAEEKPALQFQWQLKPGLWVDYESDENELLVKAKLNHRSVVKFSSQGHNYEIDLDAMEQTCTSVHAGAGKIRLRVAPKSPAREIRSASAAPPAIQKACSFRGGVRRTSFRTRAAPKAQSRPTRRTATSPKSFQPGRFVGPPLPQPSRSNSESDVHSQGEQLPNGGYSLPPDPLKTVSLLPDGIAWPCDDAAKRIAETLLSQLVPIFGERRRRAFKGACLRWHPDKNPEDENTATEVFQFLQRIKAWYLDEFDEQLLM